MAEADIGILFFGGTIAAIVLVCIVLTVRYGGLRGAMFGARVQRELGEVGAGSGMFGRRLRARVFQLEGDGDASRVGLEVRNYGKRWYATLSATDARRLAELLTAAGR